MEGGKRGRGRRVEVRLWVGEVKWTTSVKGEVRLSGEEENGIQSGEIGGPAQPAQQGYRGCVHCESVIAPQAAVTAMV